MSDYLRDLAERAAWTLAEAAVAFAITETADLQTAYAPVIATALAALKGWVGRHVGDPGSAALAPKRRKRVRG